MSALPLQPLLRLESLAVGALAVWGFALTDVSWVWFAALILAPDLGMIGYLGGPRLGAACYNAVHTYVAPAVLAAVAGWTLGLAVASVWAAHIGLDRTLGYGLMLPDGFRHTHLGQIGRTET
ncbi:MAG: DUF4260 domain-containing protein [Bacteroidota bacterium]